MPEKVLTKKDVDSLGAKLEQFSEGLPEQEKNVLGWLMARARAASTTEVSEEDLEAVSGGLADSLGFDSEADKVEVSVSWSK